MKKIILLLLVGISIFVSSCKGNADTPTETVDVKTPSTNSQGEVIVLTNEMYKQQIFNYEVNKEWEFEGDLPVIIDFYATWCGPCQMMSPRIEAIAKQFSSKIRVYKADVDQEGTLAQNLGISVLPTLLFIPMEGKPQATTGALSKDELVKAINDILKVK